MDWVLDMTPWTWLIIGLVLLVLELLAPAIFFLWLGAAAIVTAGVLFLIPELSWQAQILIFSILSVVSIYGSRRYIKSRPLKSELPNLNRRSSQYVGRVFTLTEPIRNGYGKISVDDTRWQVRGPEMEAGRDVRVVSADGSILTVEAE
ncbi:MAG: NfeD family protein [Pseudomonadota bacterium]